MRIRNALCVWFAVILFWMGSAVGGTVKRYKTDEIKTLYQSSRFFFDRGEYRKAINVLKNIDPHQHVTSHAHIKALKIVDDWSYHYKQQLRSLERLGVDITSLFRVSCEYARNRHKYSMYAVCAKNDHGFVEKVDGQIRSMLKNYYRRKKEPYHKFSRLSALVNEDELAMSLEMDVPLLRERIGAVLTDSNCDNRPRHCLLPVESILPVIGKFVYGTR